MQRRPTSASPPQQPRSTQRVKAEGTYPAPLRSTPTSRAPIPSYQISPPPSLFPSLPFPIAQSIPSSIIPIPTSSPQSRSGASRASKKSHAKRQPEGHIPRPRNAFILFRCDFVAQKKVPASIEHDHRNISRIAGRIWQGMDEAAREPWLKLAEKEKAKHKERFPGYRYMPSGNGKEAKADEGKGAPAVDDRWQNSGGPQIARGPWPEPVMVLPRLQTQIPRRPSSCPPPATSGSMGTYEDTWGMLTAQDDLQRRPSRMNRYVTGVSPSTSLLTRDGAGGAGLWNFPSSQYSDADLCEPSLPSVATTPEQYELTLEQRDSKHHNEISNLEAPQLPPTFFANFTNPFHGGVADDMWQGIPLAPDDTQHAEQTRIHGYDTGSTVSGDGLQHGIMSPFSFIAQMHDEKLTEGATFGELDTTASVPSEATASTSAETANDDLSYYQLGLTHFNINEETLLNAPSAFSPEELDRMLQDLGQFYVPPST